MTLTIKTDYFPLRYAEISFKIEKLHVLCKVKLIFSRVGKIAKKKTISFVMSLRPFVCAFVRMEQLDSHWMDCQEI